MSITSRRFPAGSLRVSDAERDRALAELSDHYQAGRLSTEEFDDRSGRALRARTGQELSSLFADLPEDQTHRIDPSASPVWATQPPGPDRIGRGRLAWSAGQVAVPVLRIALAVAVIGSLFGWLSIGPGIGHRAASLILPLLLILLIVRRVTRGRR